MRAQQEGLLAGGPCQRDEHIGNVLVGALVGRVRSVEVRTRESLQQGTDVIGELAIDDASLPQDVTR